MRPELNVMFDHDDFVVVNKSNGIQMHQADGDYAILPLMKHIGFSELHLVHRLDADTSGLMILAKHANTAAKFGVLFQERLINKYYLAISSFKPKKKQGHVLGDMRKVRNGNYALCRSTDNPAYTQFMSQSLVFDQGNNKRLFILRPLTGKTHQLRVALKSLGSPILGDKRYTNDQEDRMYLHAFCISFV